MSGDGDDTERVSVKTYVPRDQKVAWRERADELDMSQSEFVRTMVQAGVRDLGLVDDGASSPAGESDTDGDESRDLEARVLAELDERDVADWDALVASLSGDFEERLEDALDALTDRGAIKYSPRDGGYVRLEDGDA